MSWPSRVFLSGQAASLPGDGLAVLAIPLLVLGLTRSPLISALSAASQTLGYLAVGLPAGVLVDRLDAWRVLVVTDAARAVAFAALYLLWVTGAARLAVRGNVPHTSRRRGGWPAITADFRAGIRYLLSVRVLVIMTVMQIIVNLCLATEKLMFFYARDTLGLGAAGVGAVVAAGGLGGVAGALSATWLAARFGQMRVIVATGSRQRAGPRVGQRHALTGHALRRQPGILVGDHGGQPRQPDLPPAHRAPRAARPGDHYRAPAVPHRRPVGRGHRGRAGDGHRRPAPGVPWRGNPCRGYRGGRLACWAAAGGAGE